MWGQKSILFVLVLWTVLTIAKGRLYISECLPPLNSIVLPADSQSFSVTCDGLHDSNTAVWTITGRTTTAQLTCESGAQQCSSNTTDIQMARTSSTYFVVNVTRDSNSWFGDQGADITCSSPQDPTAKGTCGIRLASPPPTTTTTEQPRENVALNLNECPQGGVTLREDRYPAVLTCEGFSDSDSVTWYVRRKTLGPGRQEDSVVDFNSFTCGPGSMFCYFKPDPFVFALRGNGRSTLHILNEYRLRKGRDSIQCRVGNRGKATCDVEAINPAVVSDADCQVTPTNNGWSVTGSCYFKGAYSTPDIYTCNWLQQASGQPDRTIPGQISKTKFEKHNAEYHNGTCSFVSALPTQEGRYTYVMDFFPGPDVKPTLDVTIQRPGAPIVRCPNSSTNNVRCDCLPNPTTPGSPLPTVQWTDNGSGQSGQQQVNLDLSTVTAAQLPVCRLTWGPSGDQVVMETPLAFGPDVVSIIRPQRNHTVGQYLSLTCDVSNAFPNVTITWTSSIAGFSCSPLDADSVCTFTVAQYHDRETVTCTARNGLFPDTMFGSDSFTIYVGQNSTTQAP